MTAMPLDLRRPCRTGFNPQWISGLRFYRIAAAGEPLAFSPIETPTASYRTCCEQCGKEHPPVVDEYYFWLVNSQYDEEQTQDADVGKGGPTDPGLSDWERPDKAPGLLYWPMQPMVWLAWCRVHNGEFSTPRRSDDGVAVDDASAAELQFDGRLGDSLRFHVTHAKPAIGCSDPSLPGFRYDMTTDTCVVLPTVPPAPVLPPMPGGLSAYPFFVYFEPGAPLEPSLYCPAIAVAASLRSHCKYEAALKWYELYFSPLNSDCLWPQCPKQPHPLRATAAADKPAARRNIRARERKADHGAGGKAVMDSPTFIPDNPCCPSEIITDDSHDSEEDLATKRARLRQRAILLHYLETLLQFADFAPVGMHPRQTKKPGCSSTRWCTFSARILRPFIPRTTNELSRLSDRLFRGLPR